MAIEFTISMDGFADLTEAFASRSSKARIHCSSCGRFAKVVRSGAHHSYYSNEVDPWWEVECSRCGEREGMLGEL